MSASYLIEMRDVTHDIFLKSVLRLRVRATGKPYKQPFKGCNEKLKREVEEHYDVQVKEFFEGNEYYLLFMKLSRFPIGWCATLFYWKVWRRYRQLDVATTYWRLFLLRVYMGEDGKPADYSESNQPYKPKHFLPVPLVELKKETTR